MLVTNMSCAWDVLKAIVMMGLKKAKSSEWAKIEEKVIGKKQEVAQFVVIAAMCIGG